MPTCLDSRDTAVPPGRRRCPLAAWHVALAALRGVQSPPGARKAAADVRWQRGTYVARGTGSAQRSAVWPHMTTTRVDAPARTRRLWEGARARRRCTSSILQRRSAARRRRTTHGDRVCGQYAPQRRRAALHGAAPPEPDASATAGLSSSAHVWWRAGILIIAIAPGCRGCDYLSWISVPVCERPPGSTGSGRSGCVGRSEFPTLFCPLDVLTQSSLYLVV